MHRFISLLCLLLIPTFVHAWNAAGHRLIATMAWQQLSPFSRPWIEQALLVHPDVGRWQQRIKEGPATELFAEASTWPDDIRSDPRFRDSDSEPVPPNPSPFADTLRHKDWHYTDRDEQGRQVAGQLEQQLARLETLLRSTTDPGQIAYALPWLIHLVGDLHQPLHVGLQGDDGGNALEIENPFNPRLPFTNLHSYWDDLPGPPWLRGKRLHEQATRLLEAYPPPQRKQPGQWANESHALLAECYPAVAGSLLPVVTAEFRQKTLEIAERRLVDAGYRLAWLIEEIVRQRVSRETRP